MTSGALNHDLMSPSAAILIIGDEILSGQTHDLNVPYMALFLGKLGIELHHVAMIKDCENAIIQNVNTLRQAYDYVFTTGGIGPTHDDITAASIAKAFGTELYFDEAVMARMLEKYPQHVPPQYEALKRMAHVPKGSSLITSALTAAPGFSLENVHVLAGIPSIMQSMLDTLAPKLRRGPVRHRCEVSGPATEGILAPGLEKIQKDYPRVSIGSYPRWNQKERGVKIVLSSYCLEALKEAEKKVRNLFKHHGFPIDQNAET